MNINININMYRTAKSLEITEVEVHTCFILCPYLFFHKTLIIERFYIKLAESIDYSTKI